MVPLVGISRIKVANTLSPYTPLRPGTKLNLAWNLFQALPLLTLRYPGVQVFRKLETKPILQAACAHAALLPDAARRSCHFEQSCAAQAPNLGKRLSREKAVEMDEDLPKCNILAVGTDT